MTEKRTACDELIPVRKGEELEVEVLERYLRGRLDGAEGNLSILQFSGGHANLTYLLKFGDQEFVLRRPPLGQVASKAHDMGREFRVLSRLYMFFPLAPRALLYCEDTDVIGAPFFIMERRSGIVVRERVPPVFGGGADAAGNRTLSEVLVDTLADLHAVDFLKAGLQDLGRPEGYMLRQVEGWAERYTRARTKEIPFVGDLRAWLLDRMPAAQRQALVHNDWRLDNIMLHPEDPGRVVAVFDWDMCTLGDPLADLGCLLSFWFEKGEGMEKMAPMPSVLPGFMSRKEAVERYGARSGLDMAKADVYHVFGLFKMAVVVQQIYYRYSRGQTLDKRFETFGLGAELLMSQAWELACSFAG